MITAYKKYMKEQFWPWFWLEPCGDCDCPIDLFKTCEKYDKWLNKKPIYKGRPT